MLLISVPVAIGHTEGTRLRRNKVRPKRIGSRKHVTWLTCWSVSLGLISGSTKLFNEFWSPEFSLSWPWSWFQRFTGTVVFFVRSEADPGGEIRSRGVRTSHDVYRCSTKIAVGWCFLFPTFTTTYLVSKRQSTSKVNKENRTRIQTRVTNLKIRNQTGKHFTPIYR